MGAEASRLRAGHRYHVYPGDVFYLCKRPDGTLSYGYRLMEHDPGLDLTGGSTSSRHSGGACSMLQQQISDVSTSAPAARDADHSCRPLAIVNRDASDVKLIDSLVQCSCAPAAVALRPGVLTEDGNITIGDQLTACTRHWTTPPSAAPADSSSSSSALPCGGVKRPHPVGDQPLSTAVDGTKDTACVAGHDKSTRTSEDNLAGVSSKRLKRPPTAPAPAGESQCSVANDYVSKRDCLPPSTVADPDTANRNGTLVNASIPASAALPAQQPPSWGQGPTAQLVAARRQAWQHNERIHRVLSELADVYHVLSDEFRQKSFETAAAIVATMDQPLRSLADARDAGLGGDTTANTSLEIAMTGRSQRLDRLTANPTVVAALLFVKVFGVGPVKARQYAEKGYRTLEDLTRDQGLDRRQRMGIKYATMVCLLC